MIPASGLPPTSAALLDHERHMTAVIEAHHGARVAVHVLGRAHDGERYAREILLSLPDGRVVQYAVVDIALGCCPAPVREGIVAERIPLGRVLQPIADELQVLAVGFVRVSVPSALAARFGCAAQATGYGRLVHIRRGDEVLIEGLELLTPALA